MHPVFPPCSPSPLSPALPPFFLFSLVFGCTPSTTLLPFFPLVFSPCLALKPIGCSVCHTIIVILTTHLYDVLLPSFSPLSHSQHTSRLHLDARLGPHGEQGCWQHLKRTLSQRSTPSFLQHLPLPHVCEDTTLQLLCAAITNHHCSAHSPAGIEDTASASHHDDGQDNSASLLSLLLPFVLLSSYQCTVSSTCKAEECDVMRYSTNGCRSGCAC